MIKHILLSLSFILHFSFVNSQIDGDILFAQDQIISLDLNFSNENFWDELTGYYQNDIEDYVAADLTITDLSGTYTFNDVGVRLKGNSSYNHPGNKKSFKIDFNEFVPGQNYDGLKKLNFSNGFKDPSCLREKVFFGVAKAAGVLAPRSNFANVTINGTPWGFYTVVEQIDDQFLDWAILDDAGNLFKAGDNFGVAPGSTGEAADLVYYGAQQSAYEAKYELKTNEDVNDWSDLIDFIDFINNSDDESFENELANRLELNQFLRSAAMDNLFSNLDSYTGSARNYYLYHNLQTNKWRWIKWDANEAFGSYNNGVNNITSLAFDYRNLNRPILQRIFNNETLYDLYLQEICSLNEQFFNSAYLDARIDELYSLIKNSVYADNNKMYTNTQFDANIESNITSGGGPGGGTIYGLKSFIISRLQYVNANLDCGVFSSIDKSELNTMNIFPNPANETINIELSKSYVNKSCKIEVLSTDGRVLSDENIKVKSDAPITINVNQLSNGFYFIRCSSSSGISTMKFIKN